MTTPAQMLTDVRNQLYESDDDFWTDDELFSYMSKAQSDIARNVLVNNARYTTTSVINDPLIDYPSTLLYLTGVTYDGEIVEKITQKQYDEMYSEEPSASTPDYYIDFTTSLELVPKPDALGKTIRLNYIADPAAVTSISTKFSIPPLFHELILNYTLWRAISKDSDDSRSGMFLSLYQNGLVQARADQATFDYIDSPQLVKVVD